MAQQTAAGELLSDGGSQLNRNVGLVGLTFVSVGSVIGSGWLLSAQNAASEAGPAVLITWVVAAVICIIIALTYAELGAAYPAAGGTARYTFLSHGPLGGFFGGWVSWLQAVALAPVETLASLNYLDANWWPNLTKTGADSQTVLTGKGLLVAIGFVAVFTVINMVGVRWLAESNKLIVMWKIIIPLLTIVAILTQQFHTANFHLHNVKGGGGFEPFGLKGMILALGAGGVLFSYQGFEQAVQLGGEARNPKRDLPRAIVISILLGTVVYIALQVCFIAAYPSHGLESAGWAGLNKGNFGPFYQLAQIVGLTWLATLLQADAIVSPGGTSLCYLGTTSRLSFALSRGGVAPRSLARLNGRRVPWISLLLAFIVGCVLFAPFGDWAKLVNYVTSATFFMYALAPIAVMTLRRALPERTGERTYRVPFANVWCPVAFVLANIIVYWSGYPTDWRIAVAFVAGAVLLAIGLATGPPLKQPLALANVAWIPVWVGGLIFISGIGSKDFDGRNWIPFGWDILVVAAFSLAIFFWAVLSAVPVAQVKANLAEMADEAQIEEDIFGGQG